MITIQKYFEERQDGNRTGRVLYLVKSETPDAKQGCVWRIDQYFKIDDEMTHDPEKLNYYSIAIVDGFVIVED